jgi:thiamine-phosphate pyrophosphorylase
MKPSILRGLYAITDGPRDDLLQVVTDVLTGGARVLQYRDETDHHLRRRHEATELAAICRAYDVPLIIDNDVALARRVSAAGVHLSQEPADLAAARGELGEDAIIGVSCYASMDLAHKAVRGGADYISFGAFYPSITKPDAGHAPIDLLHQSAHLGLPRVAIGGITLDNAHTLVDAGADCLAVVSALFRANHPRQTAQQFASLYL